MAKLGYMIFKISFALKFFTFVLGHTGYVTEPKFESARPYAVKSICWHCAVMKENAVYCKAPFKESETANAPNPELWDGFQKNIFTFLKHFFIKVQLI